jgi:hypothetical protein
MPHGDPDAASNAPDTRAEPTAEIDRCVLGDFAGLRSASMTSLRPSVTCAACSAPTNAGTDSGPQAMRRRFESCHSHQLSRDLAPKLFDIAGHI